MESILDFFEDQGSEPEGLQEVRLGTDPTAVFLFSDNGERVVLHYLEDDAYRCYGVCPGERCPVCFLGTAPSQFALMPVFDVETAEVRVLRISVRRGTGSLFAGLQPLLTDPEVAEKVTLISRKGNRYSVHAKPLGDSADRGEPAIRRFLSDVEAGLKLSSAFIAPSAAELAEIPRIRRKLDAVGGYRPPDARTSDSGDVADENGIGA